VGMPTLQHGGLLTYREIPENELLPPAKEANKRTEAELDEAKYDQTYQQSISETRQLCHCSPARNYGRYGYRRITALLRKTGWQVGKDRVHRIWRGEGLNIFSKLSARMMSSYCTGASTRTNPVHHQFSR
jgi:HTH-like domain